MQFISISFNMKIQTLAIFLLFMLPNSWVYSRPTCSADSLQMPEKILNLPNDIVNEGDRAGSWGLPTVTALHYGLVIDSERDDRFDEEACRQAALRYLADLYAEFGDWDLCYYAYLYSPAYVRNLQMRNLSIPQPKPEIKRPAKPKIVDTPKTQSKTKEAKCTTYTVKSGDTLGKIAKQHHVSVADIKKWNNLKNDLIRVNQKLKIYQ